MFSKADLDKLSQEAIIYIIRNVEYFKDTPSNRREDSMNFILTYTGSKTYGIDFLLYDNLLNISIGDHILGCYFSNENAYKTYLQFIEDNRCDKISQLINDNAA